MDEKAKAHYLRQIDLHDKKIAKFDTIISAMRHSIITLELVLYKCCDVKVPGLPHNYELNQITDVLSASIGRVTAELKRLEFLRDWSANERNHLAQQVASTPVVEST